MEGVTAGGAVTARAARWGLALLTLVNLVNYLDRYIVAALVTSLKKVPGFHLSDARAGSLMTGFVLVYLATSPIFGALGDRRSRPALVALGVGLWSVATMLSGLARSFLGLFAARAAVGVGEAAYATIAPALLADYFPHSSRGRAFSVFYAAIPVGAALGYVAGGLVAARWGWRAAFLVAGGPGLLAALALLGLPDPPRGVLDEAPAARAGAVRLARNVPYLVTVAGYAAYTFGLGGLAFWMPAFLTRVRGVSEAQATVRFGTIVVVTGFAGTFAGGWLGDRLLARTRQAYLWVSGVTTLAAAPLALVALRAKGEGVAFAALAAAELLAFASTGPINSAIVNVVAPEVRATAVAISILAIHLLGDVPSPVLVGALSDAASLRDAIQILPAALLAGGLVWTAGAAIGSRRGWAS